MSLQDELEKVRAETPEEDDPETEPETPDTDEDEEAEEAEEAAPAPPIPVDTKALERELQRHEKAMVKLLGSGFTDMERCPTCDTMGYVPADFEPPPELRELPGVVRCDHCNGYGIQTTPSLAENYRVIPCTVCQGHGYRQEQEVRAEQQAAERMAQQPVYTPASAPPAAPQWDGYRNVWVDASGNVLQAGQPTVNGPVPA